MRHLIYISLFLLPLAGFAQNYADKEYYLIDSLNLSQLSGEDKYLIDSCLNIFHQSKSDSDRVDALDYICENMINHNWARYQFYQYSLIEKILKEKHTKKLTDRYKRSLALALNNIGFIYNDRGNLNQAEVYYNKALVTQKEIQDKAGIAATLNNIGTIYYNRGDLIRAIEFYHESLTIQEEIGNDEGVAYLLNNIGSIYQNQNNFSDALKYFNKALTIQKKQNNKKGMSYTYNSIGDIYRDQGNLLRAIETLNIALSIRKEIKDKHGEAYTLNSIGSCYDYMDDYIKALYYSNQSLIIREQINDKEGLAYTLNSLGNYLLKQKDISGAKLKAERAFTISKEIGFPELISRNAKLLSSIYLLENNPKKSLKMYKMYIQMRDSILNEQSQKATAQQQAKYEYEKQKAIDDAEHEKQIAIEQEAKAKQKVITYATAGGLGLVVIFLVFVFSRLQVTKKQKLVIETQKIEVEQQKEEVELAHHELEEKNQEILDSITYAKRIQNAILPPLKVVKEYLNESFILYRPKDIVAGDFYWLESVSSSRHPELDSESPNKEITGQASNDDIVLFAAADCTGHGVPGAMVSVVCNNGLNRSVREFGLTDPGEILNKTREIVIAEFEKSEDEVKDGMDIALCSLEGTTLKYAGANNPLWIIRNNEIIETKADKQPIGKFDELLPYSTHTFELQKGDSIYIFSDGYVDQFGGEKGKKFKAAAFRTLLLSIQDKSMEEQQTIINSAFEDWKGNLEQIDDVCIIGVKIV